MQANVRPVYAYTHTHTFSFLVIHTHTQGREPTERQLRKEKLDRYENECTKIGEKKEKIWKVLFIVALCSITTSTLISEIFFVFLSEDFMYVGGIRVAQAQF
jgi:hypothetical protein